MPPCAEALNVAESLSVASIRPFSQRPHDAAVEVHRYASKLSSLSGDAILQWRKLLELAEFLSNRSNYASKNGANERERDLVWQMGKTRQKGENYQNRATKC